MRDYLTILGSLEFMAYSTLATSSFICIVVYIANLSVIFVNHMDMGLTEFSYWQASTMGTFIVFVLVAAKLIGNKGLDYTKNLGSVSALIGVVAIFCVAQTDYTNVPMICLLMAFVAVGGALAGSGTYGVKAMSIFPEMNGSATAILILVRQLGCSALVLLSGVMFDGTIVPVANIIFGFGMFAAFCYVAVRLKEGSKVA